MYKQVILVRTDLKLSKGKMAAQCSHASVDAVLKSSKTKIDSWQKEGMKKSILKVKDKTELMEYKKKAGQLKLKTALIIDAGKTHLEPGTVTCLAIGPDKEKEIDKVTGKLKLIS